MQMPPQRSQALRPPDPSDRADARGKVVGSVASGIRILRRLSREARPMRVTELARDLQLNPSTCFNILRTMVGENVVAFDPAKKTYALAVGLLELVPKGRVRESDVSALRPAMERLAGDHQVLVTLWRRTANRMVLIMSAEADAPLGISMPIGCRMPLYIGAVGRALAAATDAPIGELKAHFDELRWQRAPTFRRYLAEIEEARARGWSLDRGDYAQGILTVSAPVRLAPGAADHACSATMFIGQHDDARLKLIADALVDMGRPRGR